MKNLIYLFVLLCCSSACKTQNLFRTSEHGNAEALLTDGQAHISVIQPDHKISVSIWNHDDLSIGSVFSIYNSNEAYGKWVLVNDSGEVVLPRVGKVRLGGLTCPAAADTLEQLYAPILVDPVIVVKILNREVTVLGEVRTPGVYLLEKEKNTLTELIGKAQGFERYADLERVQLIREGVSYELDLTELNQPSYHSLVMQAGDLLHVASRKEKRLDEKAPTIIPFASALTAVAVFFSIFARS